MRWIGFSELQAAVAAISTSGLFDAPCYRRQYLRFSPFRAWPTLHYVLLGERLGWRPNAFFNPHYYRQQLAAAGCAPRGPLLQFYADQGALRGESPSREFEHAWYAWQNPDWKHCGANAHPMRHFLEVGLPERRDPSPFIDLRRLINTMPPGVASAPHNSLISRVQRDGRLEGPGVIPDLADLRRRQAAFRQRLNYSVLRRGRPIRADLVYLQCGRSVRPPYLLHARRFDVLRNYYADPAGEVCPESDHVLFQRGTKVTGIAGILRNDPELLLAYDHVLFLDDDITLSAAEIEQFFDTMRRHRAALGQPLLTSDSDCVWSVFKNQAHAGQVVPVNSVEVMMPAFSREALRRLAWTFNESISGFGVDLLWGHSLPEDREAGRVVLIGEVKARHEKAIDDVGGAFYRFMAENGINPKLELWMIMRQYGVVPDFRAIGNTTSEAS